MSSVAALAGSEFFDFVGHHSLQPGLAFGTGEFQKAHPMLPHSGSIISGGIVVLDQHRILIQQFLLYLARMRKETLVLEQTYP